MHATQPAPSTLVGPDGRVHTGVFDGPLANPDLHRAALRHWGLSMPAAWSRFRLKEWEHTLLVLPGELLLTVAVVEARYLGSTWVHGVDLRSLAHWEHARQGPTLRRAVGYEQLDGHTWAEARGYRLDLRNHLARGEHIISMDLAARGSLPAVSGELRIHHDLEAIRPLVVCLPVGPNRGQYSHKVALPMEGELRVGDRVFRADADTARAVLDVHKAHYPRQTWWNWATGVGRTTCGRDLAFNLTRNLNQREDEINENGVWIDGALERQGPARIEHGVDLMVEPWQVGTVDDAVDLVFAPLRERAADLNLGLVQSRFHQPCGRFSGRLSHGGRDFELGEVWGVCEDHRARW